MDPSRGKTFGASDAGRVTACIFLFGLWPVPENLVKPPSYLMNGAHLAVMTTMLSYLNFSCKQQFAVCLGHGHLLDHLIYCLCTKPASPLFLLGTFPFSDQEIVWLSTPWYCIKLMLRMLHFTCRHISAVLGLYACMHQFDAHCMDLNNPHREGIK